MIPTIYCSRVPLRPWSGRLLRAVFLISALALAACSGFEVQETVLPEQPAALLAEERPERNLALTGLRIAPDLSRAIEFRGGATSFRLQATVENRGAVDEEDVLVEAWLRAPAQHGGMVLMQGVQLAPLLAAGDARVVQISASGVVPILPSYVLEVSVRPALQEQYLGDNVARYEISVSSTEAPLG